MVLRLTCGWQTMGWANWPCLLHVLVCTCCLHVGVRHPCSVVSIYTVFMDCICIVYMWIVCMFIDVDERVVDNVDEWHRFRAAISSCTAWGPLGTAVVVCCCCCLLLLFLLLFVIGILWLACGGDSWGRSSRSRVAMGDHMRRHSSTHTWYTGNVPGGTARIQCVHAVRCTDLSFWEWCCNINAFIANNYLFSTDWNYVHLFTFHNIVQCLLT